MMMHGMPGLLPPPPESPDHEPGLVLVPRELPPALRPPLRVLRAPAEAQGGLRGVGVAVVIVNVVPRAHAFNTINIIAIVFISTIAIIIN